jgi:hypothetical protein
LIRPHLDLLTFSRVDEEIVDVIAARGKNAADLPVTARVHNGENDYYEKRLRFDKESVTQ